MEWPSQRIGSQRFSSGDAANVGIVQLRWRRVIVPAAGRSADFTAATVGAAWRRFLLGKQFFNSRNAFHFNRNRRQTALKSGISWVTFQLILSNSHARSS
ncbi:hypothetical protein ACNKHW_03055 [Shigella flexneri]